MSDTETTTAEPVVGEVVDPVGESSAPLAVTQEKPANGSAAAGSRFTRSQIDLIKRTILQDKATDDELELFLATCNRTKLDPIARQIWATFRRRWDEDTNQYEERMEIQVAIDGFRLVAERTGKYRGQVGPFWHPGDEEALDDDIGTWTELVLDALTKVTDEESASMIRFKIENGIHPFGPWRMEWISNDRYPAAAKVGVLHENMSKPIWGIVRWGAFAQTKKSGELNRMWKTGGDHQLAKCAEAQGLRKAFPQELGNAYTPDELAADDHLLDEIRAERERAESEQLRSQVDAVVQRIDICKTLQNLNQVASDLTSSAPTAVASHETVTKAYNRARLRCAIHDIASANNGDELTGIWDQLPHAIRDHHQVTQAVREAIERLGIDWEVPS